MIKNEKYQCHDRDDLDYYGIKGIENLFDNVDDDDYYKPILINSSFKKNTKFMEAKGIKFMKVKRIKTKTYQ